MSNFNKIWEKYGKCVNKIWCGKIWEMCLGSLSEKHALHNQNRRRKCFQNDPMTKILKHILHAPVTSNLLKATLLHS